jgi:hypothetical protein
MLKSWAQAEPRTSGFSYQGETTDESVAGEVKKTVFSRFSNGTKVEKSH